MEHPRRLWFTFALTMALVSSNAMSEVYRWTDSQGKVHFGDRHDQVNPQTVQEVVVPRPNVVSGFKGSPAAPDSAPSSSPDTATVPAPKSGPRGVAATAKQSCKEKVEAYRASKACFDTCGKQNGNLNGRNNAGCEQCVDLPMPNC